SALGDVDGDGDLDAFVGNYGAQNRLHLNDGTGVFADVTSTSLPALLDNTMAIALGDVDGDGDLDTFVGNEGQSRLYLNGGTGDYTDVTATSLPTLLFATTEAVALGDLDGDGDLDAFLANSNTTPRLYLNGGTGVFTDVTVFNLPAILANTMAIALGDVDGDGDLDAFLGTLGPCRLFLNGGTGVFTDATVTNLPALSDITQAVALGDVDVDGDLDAFVGNATSVLGQQIRLYVNGGTGVFADVTATNLPASSDSTTSLALGDVDVDGDLDAFVGNGASFMGQQNRLYLNGGTGVFTDVTASDLPALNDTTGAVALGDLDGDGDLDAFVGKYFAQSRLYTNLSRQLAWRGIPRAGKLIALDLRGPANGTWLLAASAAVSSIPLPPFGTLRLDPATLFIVAGGPLDPQGRASLTFPVPVNPTLVGASLYWQGLVGPPLRFTNLEITTVTNL
ncbi:MAG: FG-GAP-like repeat-containing protein, partial [Planctomycetes bacterium]|nr:FG-GAP-like repeat-containing protein [Planctomycetota bacterium]